MTILESILARDRIVVAAALLAVTVAAWAYTLLGVGMEHGALDMTAMAVRMPGMAMAPATWTPAYAVLVFLMWWVMMIAMMVPSAAPMVLLFAALRRKAAERTALPSTCVFILGYLAAWAAFGLAATSTQWGLERAGLLTGMMEAASAWLAGGILVAAGLYQFTPLKRACLVWCQSPLGFVMTRWRPGVLGALRMGVEHGTFCTGCCWFLMALLFAGGVMNLFWIGAIALYVLIEKLAFRGPLVARGAGAALVLAGTIVLVRAV